MAIQGVELASEELFSPDDLPRELRGRVTTFDELDEAQRGDRLWCAFAASGDVVGFAVAVWLGGDLHLEEIAVHPRHQQRGLGTQLVAAVRAFAVARGASSLTLTTFRSPPWNRPWYEALGFVSLATHEMPTELAAVFEAEVEGGLARDRRVAMLMRLV